MAGTPQMQRQREDVAYLSTLQDDAGVVFQALIETAPATLTDPELAA